MSSDDLHDFVFRALADHRRRRILDLLRDREMTTAHDSTTLLEAHMDTSTAVEFSGGRNIAMKVPPHLWDATVGFYRDVIGLPIITQAATVPPSMCFPFGANQLWVDRVDGLSQAEVWLELTSRDVEGAAAHLAAAGIVRRDEIEALPDGFGGFWIENPASIIHLVAKPGQY